MSQISQLETQIREADIVVKKLEKARGPRTKLQRIQERGSVSRSQWKMIKVVQDYLIGFACLDLTLQVIVQMPFVYNSHMEQAFGIRKIWLHPLADPSKAEYFSFNTIIDHGHAVLFEGLAMDYSNWYMQIAISIMIVLISL